MSADLTGQTLLNKLRVLRMLGRGSYGAVYEVEHALTGNRHALKVLHADAGMGPTEAQRFVREAGVAARVRSPRVAGAIDAGQLSDGRLYLLMDLLEGRTWAELLAQQGFLHPDHLIRLARQVCEGLAAAHAAGVVHRDLKPANVFLAGPPGREEVRILDFGVARNLPGHTDAFGMLTATGGVLGTPQYLSPEQGRGQAVDGRTDQYALGVMMYESLVGRPPFVAPTLAALIAKIVEGDCEPVAVAARHVPKELAAIVTRAMHSDRDRRYPHMRALDAALASMESAHADPSPSGPPATATAPPALANTVHAIASRDPARAATVSAPSGDRSPRTRAAAAAVVLDSAAPAPATHDDGRRLRFGIVLAAAALGMLLLACTVGIAGTRLLGILDPEQEPSTGGAEFAPGRAEPGPRNGAPPSPGPPAATISDRQRAALGLVSSTGLPPVARGRDRRMRGALSLGFNQRCLRERTSPAEPANQQLRAMCALAARCWSLARPLCSALRPSHPQWWSLTCAHDLPADQTVPDHPRCARFSPGALP